MYCHMDPKRDRIPIGSIVSLTWGFLIRLSRDPIGQILFDPIVGSFCDRFFSPIRDLMIDPARTADEFREVL